MGEGTELEENIKGVFSEILGGALDVEILNRALSAFLSDNYVFSDFDLNFNPPVILSKNKFMALIKKLSEYFDDFGFSGFVGQIFMIMARANPYNKKRLVIVYKHINGKNISIESISGKTYTNV